MRLARKYSIPSELSLLYEFLNSADLRTYVEKGEEHVPSDELGTPAHFAAWMQERGLLKKGEVVAATDHRQALELRSAMRSYLQLPPDARRAARKNTDSLNRLSDLFPLVVKIPRQGEPELRPARGANRLGLILVEFFSLAATGHLDRLKMCSSDECHWVFFDKSKPGNRRWCSSFLCGNRQKTRDYRKRARIKIVNE
jgi:predicted RNA-binding Zn ribbon-like protein